MSSQLVSQTLCPCVYNQRQIHRNLQSNLIHPAQVYFVLAVEDVFRLEIFDGVPHCLREIASMLVELCAFMVTNIDRSA